jgi:hypothetical protein
MRRNAAVPPRFVLLLEGASLPWEKTVGGGGEQSVSYKDDHMDGVLEAIASLANIGATCNIGY